MEWKSLKESQVKDHNENNGCKKSDDPMFTIVCDENFIGY